MLMKALEDNNFHGKQKTTDYKRRQQHASHPILPSLHPTLFVATPLRCGAAPLMKSALAVASDRLQRCRKSTTSVHIR